MIPVALLTIFLDMIALQEVTGANPDAAFYELNNGEIRLLDESRFNVIVGIEALIAVLAYQVVTGATLRAAGDAYMGGDPDPGTALRNGFSRVHSIIWISIIYSVLVVIGFFLLLLPGIWLAISLSLATPVLIFEGRKGRKAIDRSFNLISDNWWRTLGALLVGFILIGILYFLVPLGLDALASSVDSVILFTAILNLGQALVAIITAPFIAALLTVIYYDLLVRKEGYDVQFLAQRLGGEEGGPGGTGGMQPVPGHPEQPPAPQQPVPGPPAALPGNAPSQPLYPPPPRQPDQPQAPPAPQQRPPGGPSPSAPPPSAPPPAGQ